MPRKAKSDLTKIFPGAEPAALDLLRNLLTLDPKKRFDVKRCLSHARVPPESLFFFIRGETSTRRYVASIKNATDGADVDLSSVEIDLAFDNPATPSLRVHQLRDLIRDHTRPLRAAEAADARAPATTADVAPPPPKRAKTTAA